MSKYITLFALSFFGLLVLTACYSPGQVGAELSKNPVSGQALAPANELISQSIPAVTLTPMPVQLPDTPQPVIISTPTSFQTEASQGTTSESTPTCTNQAELIKHLTINDNAAIDAGQPFAKLWQLKNAGTCVWTTDYSLVFYSGEQMSGQQSIPFSSNVGPGELVDLRVDLVAPLNQTNYTGNWILRDASGNPFGVGDKGNQAISVTIQVKPTPMPTSGCVHCARTYD